MPYRIIGPGEQMARVILILGQPNAGKTQLCGSIANLPGEVTCYVDVDRGRTTLFSSGSRILETGQLVELSTPRDLIGLLEGLRTPKKPYTTVVIDSISRLQQFGLISVLDKAPEKAKENSARSRETKRDSTEIGDWGTLLVQMLRAVMEVLETKLTFVFTAQVEKDKDPSDGMERWLPQLSGQFARMLPGFCDVIGYLAAEREGDSIIHRLHFKPDVRYLSRDRTGLLPDCLDIPPREGWNLIDRYLKGKELRET